MRTGRLTYILLATTFCVAGCAVMRIDVDVYKGPLANTESVQAEQFRIMAIGAKHSLIRLRDSLEWNPQNPKDSEAKKKYLASYMRDYDWTNAQARRVNDVLSLYEDQTLQGLEFYANRVGPALRDYGYVYNDLGGLNDPGLWVRISSEMRSGVEEFKSAYRVYLDSSARKGELYTAADIPVSYDKNRDKFKEFGIRDKDLESAGFGPDRSSNAIFQMLTDKTRVEVHARILFSDPNGKGAREFTDSVIAKARAFITAREDLRKIWLASVETMLAIETPGHLGLDDKQRVAVIKSLAQFIAQLTPPQYLAGHFFCAQNPITALQSILKSDPVSGNLWANLPPTAPNADNYYVPAANTIARALENDPKQVSLLLLQIDSRLLQDQPYNPTCYYDYVKGKPESDSVSRRKFGLVRGPTLELSYEMLNPLFRDVTVGSAGGFESGRLPEGLQTLIDRYLQLLARPGSRSDDDKMRDAKELLLISLVQFATKILALADSNILFADDTTSTQTIAITPETRKALEPYVAILQGIGNSLLVHADDLRRQSDHLERMRARAPAERAALKQGVSQEAARFLNDLTVELNNKSRDASASLKDAKTAKDTADAAAKKADGALTEANATLAKLKQDAETKNTSLTSLQQAFEPVRNAYETFTTSGDAVAVTKAVTEGAAADGSTIMQGIIDWLETQYKYTSPGLDTTERVTRLKKTGAYLATLKPKITIASAERKLVFAKIVEIIQGDYQNGSSAVDTASKTAQQAKTALEAQTKTIAELSTANEQAKKAAQAANEAVTAKTAENTVAGDARLAIQSRIPNIVARTLDGNATAQTVFLLLSGVIQDDLNAAKKKSDQDAVKQLTAANTFLQNHKPPAPGFTVGDLPANDSETATDVLDRLIALLRHEYVLAIKEEPEGARSQRATALAEAIKAAYDQRSGMVYIRPSSTYLRSSYSATTLQSDPGLAWQNMLKEQAFRSSPFFSESVVNYGLRERSMVNAEIDKQFWQNINSVRVAGGGFTNYVITKDDIGNWYVKSYSSDPNRIIQSATKLALFNLGGATNPALLKSAVTGTAGATSAASETQQPTAQNATGIERVFQKYQGTYTTTTKTDYDKALSLDASLNTGITNAWDSDAALKSSHAPVADFKKDLTAAIDQLKTDLGTLKDASEAERGNKIVEALQSVKRAYRLLVSKIRARQSDTVTSEQITAAVGDATRVARNLLVDFTKSRQESVKSFETAIVFVGEATK